MTRFPTLFLVLGFSLFFFAVAAKATDEAEYPPSVIIPGSSLAYEARTGWTAPMSLSFEVPVPFGGENTFMCLDTPGVGAWGASRSSSIIYYTNPLTGLELVRYPTSSMYPFKPRTPPPASDARASAAGATWCFRTVSPLFYSIGHKYMIRTDAIQFPAEEIPAGSYARVSIYEDIASTSSWVDFITDEDPLQDFDPSQLSLIYSGFVPASPLFHRPPLPSQPSLTFPNGLAPRPFNAPEHATVSFAVPADDVALAELLDTLTSTDLLGHRGLLTSTEVVRQVPEGCKATVLGSEPFPVTMTGYAVGFSVPSYAGALMGDIFKNGFPSVAQVRAAQVAAAGSGSGDGSSSGSSSGDGSNSGSSSGSGSDEPPSSGFVFIPGLPSPSTPTTPPESNTGDYGAPVGPVTLASIYCSGLRPTSFLTDPTSNPDGPELARDSDGDLIMDAGIFRPYQLPGFTGYRVMNQLYTAAFKYPAALSPSVSAAAVVFTGFAGWVNQVNFTFTTDVVLYPEQYSSVRVDIALGSEFRPFFTSTSRGIASCYLNGDQNMEVTVYVSGNRLSADLDVPLEAPLALTGLVCPELLVAAAEAGLHTADDIVFSFYGAESAPSVAVSAAFTVHTRAANAVGQTRAAMTLATPIVGHPTTLAVDISPVPFPAGWSSLYPGGLIITLADDAQYLYYADAQGQPLFAGPCTFTGAAAAIAGGTVSFNRMLFTAYLPALPAGGLASVTFECPMLGAATRDSTSSSRLTLIGLSPPTVTGGDNVRTPIDAITGVATAAIPRSLFSNGFYTYTRAQLMTVDDDVLFFRPGVDTVGFIRWELGNYGSTNFYGTLEFTLPDGIRSVPAMHTLYQPLTCRITHRPLWSSPPQAEVFPDLVARGVTATPDTTGPLPLSEGELSMGVPLSQLDWTIPGRATTTLPTHVVSCGPLIIPASAAVSTSRRMLVRLLTNGEVAAYTPVPLRAVPLGSRTAVAGYTAAAAAAVTSATGPVFFVAPAAPATFSVLPASVSIALEPGMAVVFTLPPSAGIVAGSAACAFFAAATPTDLWLPLETYPATDEFASLELGYSVREIARRDATAPTALGIRISYAATFTGDISCRNVLYPAVATPATLLRPLRLTVLTAWTNSTTAAPAASVLYRAASPAPTVTARAMSGSSASLSLTAPGLMATLTLRAASLVGSHVTWSKGDALEIDMTGSGLTFPAAVACNVNGVSLPRRGTAAAVDAAATWDTFTPDASDWSRFVSIFAALKTQPPAAATVLVLTLHTPGSVPAGGALPSLTVTCTGVRTPASAAPSLALTAAFRPALPQLLTGGDNPGHNDSTTPAPTVYALASTAASLLRLPAVAPLDLSPGAATALPADAVATYATFAAHAPAAGGPAALATLTLVPVPLPVAPAGGGIASLELDLPAGWSVAALAARPEGDRCTVSLGSAVASDAQYSGDTIVTTSVAAAGADVGRARVRFTFDALSDLVQPPLPVAISPDIRAACCAPLTLNNSTSTSINATAVAAAAAIAASSAQALRLFCPGVAPPATARAAQSAGATVRLLAEGGIVAGITSAVAVPAVAAAAQLSVVAHTLSWRRAAAFTGDELARIASVYTAGAVVYPPPSAAVVARQTITAVAPVPATGATGVAVGGRADTLPTVKVTVHLTPARTSDAAELQYQLSTVTAAAAAAAALATATGDPVASASVTSAPVAATCRDSVVGSGETGVDCGGDTCEACPAGARCKVNSDCATGRCTSAHVCAQKMTADNAAAAAAVAAPVWMLLLLAAALAGFAF